MGNQTKILSQFLLASIFLFQVVFDFELSAQGKGDTKEFNEFLKDARTLRNQGEWEECIIRCDSALTLKPKSGNATETRNQCLAKWIEEAHYYFNNGRCKRALEHYERILLHDELNVSIYRRASQCAHLLGLYDKELSIRLKWANAFPKDSAAQEQLAQYYFSSCEWDNAINALEKALVVKPNNSEILNKIEDCKKYLRKGQEWKNLSNDYYDNYDFLTAKTYLDSLLSMPCSDSELKERKNIVEHRLLQDNIRQAQSNKDIKLTKNLLLELKESPYATMDEIHDLDIWIKTEEARILVGGRKGVGSEIKESLVDRANLGSYGKKYAIIIGISDYKNLFETSKKQGALIDLKYTHRDARAFKEFLETEELSGGQWDIQYFINEKATTNNIDNALTGILTRANKRDLIFVFFSGHGRSHPQREKDVYLLTYDFEVNNNRSGFAYRDLLNLIADSKAEHIIAFIDACRSGTIGFSKGKSKGPFDQNAFGERLNQIPENKVVFSSGRGTQLSWEDPKLKLSVFTHFLLKGLRGEAADHKNPQFVDLGELAEYVQKNVHEHTTKAEEMESQYPQLFEASGVTNDDFPVAIRKATKPTVRKK